MGELHHMEKGIITAKDIAKSEGVDIATIRHRWNAVFAKGTFDQNAILSMDQVQAISRNGKAKKSPEPKVKIAKPIVVNQPEPAAEPVPPARQKIGLDDVRRFLVSAILIGIVLCHAGLIWYDCSTLWETAGQIGGGAVFLVVVAAVMLAADREQYYTSESALWFVLLIDIAAWWVHFPVFRTPLVSDTITGALCAFLCACSWIALYLYRLKNTQ